MILGRISGKVTTTNFSFLVDNTSKKFEYIQIMHKEYDYVLCQIYELERDMDKEIAKCIIIGYKDEEGKVKQPRTPFEPGTEVLKAEEEFIKSIIKIGKEKGAYIGKLEGKDIDVYLNLNKLLTKHIAVLAKSGSGKSYTVAALLEEIMERRVPLLVIDPHGEYSSMKEVNDNKDDIEHMKRFNINPRGYKQEIMEYGDPNIIKSAKQIKLDDHLDPQELINLIPAKLSNNQLALLYSIIQNLDDHSFSGIIYALEQCDNNNKYSIISVIDYLRKTGIFSSNYTLPNELIQPGRCSIINLKGISPEIQEIIVYKLLKDLFEERKKEKIPPFFCVIEEAHTFVPEQGYGKSKSSSIIKTIASEGRKFGLGLCVVSQRPAIVQKTVLSQCTTQIILKVTNPNDLKAISNSVEGVTAESETEIKNIPIGTALITGIVDMPLLVNIRPRRSKHGGEAVDILKEDDTFFDDLKEFENKELLAVIKPKLSVKDIKLMSDKEIEKITSYLIPCVMFTCDGDSEFNILMDMVKGEVIVNIENKEYFEVNQIQDIKEKASYEKIEFTNVPYDEKVEKKQSIEDLRLKLDSLATIKDYKECYVLYYDVKYKD